MKKAKFYLLALAVAVMAGVSCEQQLESPSEPSEVGDKVVVNFNAGSIETKTHFAQSEKVGENTISKTLWDDSEKIGVSLNLATPVLAESFETRDEGASSSFSASLTDDGSGAYHIYAVSPYDAYDSETNPDATGFTGVSNTDNYKEFFVVIPSEQQSLATSCDPAAQLIMAEADVATLSSNVNLTFEHKTAYGVLTLKGLELEVGETVTKVSIVANASVALSGNFYYYLGGERVEDSLIGTLGKRSSGALNTITITPDSKTGAIWFACAPASVPAGAVVTVSTSNDVVYTKTTTKPWELSAGKILPISLTMTKVVEWALSLPGAIDFTDVGNRPDITMTADYYASGSNAYCDFMRFDNNGEYVIIPVDKSFESISMVGFYNTTSTPTSTLTISGSNTKDGVYTDLASGVFFSKSNNYDGNPVVVVPEDSYDYKYVKLSFSKATGNLALKSISFTVSSTEPRINAIDNISDVVAKGVNAESFDYTLKNIEPDDVTATYTGCVSNAVANNGTVSYSVSPNYTLAASEGTITLTSPSTSATKVINVSQKADVFSTSSSTVNVGYSVNSEAEFTYSSTYDVSVSVSDDTKLDAVDVDGTVLVSVKVANSSAEDVELGKIILTRNTGITDEHKTIEVTVIQKSAPAPLSQPTITATPSSTSVALEWEKIGQSIGYEVWIDPEKKVSINDKLLLTYTFEDLTPDTEYTAYIVAKGDGLNYADSPSSSVTFTTLSAGTLSEKVIYTCGFESSEGFTSGTSYQSTVEQGPDGRKWKTYYGTCSTSSAITDGQSMALRLYTTANYGYTQTEFELQKVTKVSYKAKAATSNSATILCNTKYSTDGGNTWISVDTDKTIASTATAYEFTISATGEYENVRIRFEISSNSTKPSSKNAQFTIDDITVYGMAE